MKKAKERPSLEIRLKIPPSLPPDVADVITSILAGDVSANTPLGQRAQLEMLCMMTIDFVCLHLEGAFTEVANQPGAAKKIKAKLAAGGELKLGIDRMNAGEAALMQLGKLKDPKAVMS